MAFIAEREDGTRVIPEEVDDGQDVYCPDCGGRMRPRGPMSDGRARHFFYVENMGHGQGGDHSCSGVGGESDVHRKFKSFAVSRLKELYPEFLDSCKPEQRLRTVLGDEFEELPSGKEDRQADAMMLLEQPTTTFGRGLIVEVQYRNLGKDIEETTDDYLANGFSVYWADEDDFAKDRCLLTKKQIRKNAISVWPNAVPLPIKWLDGGIPEPLHGVRDAIWFDEESHFGSNPASVPATLPNEFFDELAQEIKREYDWEELFDPPEEHTDIWCYSKVPATLPPEWHTEKGTEWWESQPWKDRFWLDEYHHINYLEEHTWNRERPVPFNRWLAQTEEGDQYWNILEAYHKFGKQKVKSGVIREKEQTTVQSTEGLHLRLLNIIRYNTGDPQPPTIDLDHIKIIACSHANYPPSEVLDALVDLEEAGKVKIVDGEGLMVA